MKVQWRVPWNDRGRLIIRVLRDHAEKIIADHKELWGSGGLPCPHFSAQEEGWNYRTLSGNTVSWDEWSRLLTFEGRRHSLHGYSSVPGLLGLLAPQLGDPVLFESSTPRVAWHAAGYGGEFETDLLNPSE